MAPTPELSDLVVNSGGAQTTTSAADLQRLANSVTVANYASYIPTWAWIGLAGVVVALFAFGGRR